MSIELFEIVDGKHLRHSLASTCIVVATYNRPASLERLLRLLTTAQYSERVDLIISIDNGPLSKELIHIAKKMDWVFGRKITRLAMENLGLRKHILECGDVVAGYEAVIILEDDLLVGPYFHQFCRQALNAYESDDGIAGISLYSPDYNEMANLPFLAESSDCSVYALQSAQSWGQCWSRRMWNQFREWYSTSKTPPMHSADMPDRIYSWPESSWKKYSMKYLVESGRTWIYPYRSHSSNCSEIGTHNQAVTNLFQVQLDSTQHSYFFRPRHDLVSYDIYFERSPRQFPELRRDADVPLIIDLYATRQKVIGPALLLTVRTLKRAPVAQYSMSLKPHETGSRMLQSGIDARLYQIEKGENIDLLSRAYKRNPAIYSNIRWQDAMHVGLSGLKTAVSRRFRKKV